MRIKILSLAVMALFLSTCFAANVIAEEIKIWGSTTCQKRFLEPGNEALKAATGVSVKTIGVGTGKGMIGLLTGKTPAAAASSPLASALKSAQKAAKKAGKEITVPDNLQFHEIYKDLIVPIVHKDNPVTALSWDQLKDIHTGKVTNWKDVGGSDLAIQIITSHEGSATRAVFQKKVMKKEAYAANKIEVKSTRLEINEVSKNKGAIGAVSEGFHKKNPADSKIITTDTISRPLALITVGPPTDTVKKVIDFYKTGGGQKFFE